MDIKFGECVFKDLFVRWNYRKLWLVVFQYNLGGQYHGRFEVGSTFRTYMKKDVYTNWDTSQLYDENLMVSCKPPFGAPLNEVFFFSYRGD